MPRKKESLIRQFFKFDPEKCKSICLITEEEICPNNPSVVEVKSCRTTIASDHASNLERHVRTCHAETYRKYAEEKQKGTNRSSSTQPKLGYGFCDKMNSIVDALIEIVTVNGRSFDLIQNSGFKKILEPMLRNLNFSLEDIEIEKFVSMKANMIRKKITRAINNKLISIKIDYTTRFNRSFLSINIQLYESGKLNNYVIAVIELDKTRNVESLKTIICQELNRFHISMEQIYTITTDNVRDHIIFCGNSLNTECEIGVELDEDCYEAEFDPIDEEEGQEYEILDDEVICNVEVKSESTSFVPYDSDETEILLDELCKDLSPDISLIEPLNTTNIISNGIRCAEYTLQRAISDTLKESKLETTEAARNIVKKLKTPKVMMALKPFLLEDPLLDSPMRWMSTYDMLIRLFEIEGMCCDTDIKNEYLDMSHDNWLKLATVVEALKPCRKATLQLQKDNVTLTDIYKAYSICIMELTKIRTDFAVLLARNLEEKIQILFTNLPFISAMFLDPTFTVTLQDSCKEEAIQHLISVCKKMSELHKPANCLLEETTASSGESTSDDGIDEFESLLENCENLNKNKKLKKEKDHIETLLRNFASQSRINSKEIVTQFWEANKMTYPELYKLACVLFEVHASQLSVKKLFSYLSFLSDPSHPKISSSLLNDMMVVRINFDVDRIK